MFEIVGINCAYCNHMIGISETTCKAYLLCFSNSMDLSLQIGGTLVPYGFGRATTEQFIEDNSDALLVEFYWCPNCGETTVRVVGKGDYYPDRVFRIRPLSAALSFTDYVSPSIAQDYEEAHNIVTLSPKASATLSRRCLQGMIRSKFLPSSTAKLAVEIDSIKENVSADEIATLHAFRKIANIGAHSEASVDEIYDIEPGAAEKLLAFLEYLIENWFVKPAEMAKLMVNIQDEAKIADTARATARAQS